MPTSNAEELGLFLKCTVIGRGVFGPCACCRAQANHKLTSGIPCRHNLQSKYILAVLSELNHTGYR